MSTTGQGSEPDDGEELGDNDGPEIPVLYGNILIAV